MTFINPIKGGRAQCDDGISITFKFSAANNGSRGVGGAWRLFTRHRVLADRFQSRSREPRKFTRCQHEDSSLLRRRKKKKKRRRRIRKRSGVEHSKFRKIDEPLCDFDESLFVRSLSAPFCGNMELIDDFLRKIDLFFGFIAYEDEVE